MNFDESCVVAVVLRNGANHNGGWMVVKEKTFKIIAYGWNGRDAFEFMTSDDAVITGPVKSIIAVKTR